MPPVMFSVITKYHKGRHSLFLYNSKIFYAFTQDILRSHLRRFLRFCVSIDHAKLLCLKAAFKGIERALIQKLFLKILILCYLD